MKSSQEIIWKPQEGPQTALLQCPVFEIFYGGARGGGKTDGSLGDWLQHSSIYGKNAIGVFFRREFKQLEEVVARSKQLFPLIGAKYNEQKAEWTMSNGARLKFRYLERDSDAEAYQGHNYTRLYIEEVTNFPSPGPINKLRATLRSAAGVPCGMRLTGNPGGPGHGWVKKRYIDPAPNGYQILTESTELEIAPGKMVTVSLDRVFIPSKLKDNKLLLLNDMTYVLRLRQSGSEQLVRAWLEGDWNVIDGAFFSEFVFEKHVLAIDWLKVIPRDAVVFRAHDWGSAKPFSVGWYALSDGTWGLPKGALVKFQEWYGAKAPNVGIKMTADKVAEGIRKREMDMKRHIKYGVADPAIFIRNGGPSIGETMLVAGVQWRPADNKRIPGWEEVHRRLSCENGEPMLYFVECCEDTIRTLPMLQHDENHPEDIDTEGEDHAGDETRYACMSRPMLPRTKGEQGVKLPKLPNEYTIDELIAKRKSKRLRAASGE